MIRIEIAAAHPAAEAIIENYTGAPGSGGFVWLTIGEGRRVPLGSQEARELAAALVVTAEAIDRRRGR